MGPISPIATPNIWPHPRFVTRCICNSENLIARKLLGMVFAGWGKKLMSMQFKPFTGSSFDQSGDQQAIHSPVGFHLAN